MAHFLYTENNSDPTDLTLPHNRNLLLKSVGKGLKYVTIQGKLKGGKMVLSLNDLKPKVSRAHK